VRGEGRKGAGFSFFVGKKVGVMMFGLECREMQDFGEDIDTPLVAGGGLRFEL
jgi:hypothetical protein